MDSKLLPRALLGALLAWVVTSWAARATTQDVRPAPPAEAAPAEGVADEVAGPARPEVPWPHVILDGLLRAHVREGVVDYVGLAKERESLADYRAALASHPLADATREETLAFWIDAYNAFTLELILERLGTIGSIKDIPASRRWSDARWQAAGRKLSLDEIEHDILRRMGEPRIHFAIVCASKSCPDLRAEAYVAERLEEQLEDATRRFLSDTRKGLRTEVERGWFGGEDHVVRLSRLFDWFEDDFAQGDVLAFVKRHAPAEAVAFLERHAEDLDVEWFDYDWTLNDAPLPPEDG